MPDLPDGSFGQPDAGAADGQDELPDTGINTDSLMVTAVEPAYGPFSGENRALVRGNGFIDGVSVSVGDRLVSFDQTDLVDSHRVSIVVPPGDPGPADVAVKRGNERAALRDGYTYNALAPDPDSGSVSGGSLVQVTGKGTSFSDGLLVTFGGEPCVDVSVLSETSFTCKTPPMSAGAVDISVSSPGSTGPPIVARQAYTYLDPLGESGEGLAGGPIDGSVNVTVIDGSLGIELSGAFVMLGEDFDTPYQGFTDENGQITFSGKGLQGPVTVHAALKCYEKGSIVAVNAVNVTIFLRSLIGVDPDCKEIPDDPSSLDFRMKQQESGGHGVAAAYIYGEVLLPARDEFYFNNWDSIPKPREGESRVIYVYTTSAGISSANVAPDAAGGVNRIVEGDAVPGAKGYPYSIVSRAAGLAVYALGGIENRASGDFTPYLMGITRDLVTAPGEDLVDVNIDVDIPLDQQLQVALKKLPAGTPAGPDWFSVEAHIDLGGEGLIIRSADGSLIDLIERPSGGSLFTFQAQPALVGSLAGASYDVWAGWYTGEDQNSPYTEVVRRGVDQTDEPETIDDWLGIPQAVSPKYGAPVPADRILRWSADGAEPDLNIVTIKGGDGVAAWRQIAPGSAREVPIPDLSGVPGLKDIAGGFVQWRVRAVRIPGFSFDQFKYTLLSEKYWTHEALNEFIMQR